MVELRQLKHILLLAEHKNFSKAAKIANISQPSLSVSIKKWRPDPRHRRHHHPVAAFDRRSQPDRPELRRHRRDMGRGRPIWR